MTSRVMQLEINKSQKVSFGLEESHMNEQNS